MFTRKRGEFASKHGSAHHDREYKSVMTLIRVDEDTIIIQSKPRTSESELSRELSRGSVFGVHKAEETTIMRFKRRGEKTTDVTLLVDLRLENFVSKEATKSTLRARLDHIMDTYFYFNDLLPSSEVTEEDGRAMGEALMHAAKEKMKSKEEIVRAFIKFQKALGELAVRYDFIETMMCAVVRNKLTPLAHVKGKAEVLSGAEGRLIGRSFAISLATTLTPSAAVNEVRKKEGTHSH